METIKSNNLLNSPDSSKFSETWTSRDGRIVLLRSITSKDKQIEKELIDGLSVQSSRYRFFHVTKEASEKMIDDFCDIDYKNEMAIIAEYNSDGRKRNVGVVRLFMDTGLETGEFAILVADDFQGSGLGTKFMETLIDIGRTKGLKSIYGTVLAENTKMLALMREFGFDVSDNSDGEVEITLTL